MNDDLRHQVPDDGPLDDGAIPNVDIPEPPHPINWNLLTANDLEQELLELNRWVDWLRHTHGLPASVIPLDRDRPTRQTTWPGEGSEEHAEETVITDRDTDFVQYVLDQVEAREKAEDAFYASLDTDTDASEA